MRKLLTLVVVLAGCRAAPTAATPSAAPAAPAAPPPTAVAPPTTGACASAVHRQFDFWLGRWDVVNATSGEECLTMVRDAPPDLIVLDNMMPGMTGLETARRLRQDGFDKPIVLFSAYVGPELQSAAQELDLNPVAKVDTPAVIRIVESLGGAFT